MFCGVGDNVCSPQQVRQKATWSRSKVGCSVQGFISHLLLTTCLQTGYVTGIARVVVFPASAAGRDHTKQTTGRAVDFDVTAIVGAVRHVWAWKKAGLQCQMVVATQSHTEICSQAVRKKEQQRYQQGRQLHSSQTSAERDRREGGDCRANQTRQEFICSA